MLRSVGDGEELREALKQAEDDGLRIGDHSTSADRGASPGVIKGSPVGLWRQAPVGF